VKQISLVTGANGFTGRRLFRILREEGGGAIVGTGRGPGPDIEACDLADPKEVEALLEKVRPTRIFHCVGSFTNSWETDFQTNVATSRNLLESIRQLGLGSRILLIGSAAEYGHVAPGPVAENTPLHPVSTYGLTKVMQTSLMEFFARQHGVDVVMARTFNLFGEGCSPLLFPGRVLRQAERVREGLDAKIQVRSLDSSRDYLPVQDAVQAYLRIMCHGCRGEIYNVGSGRPTPIKELIQNLISPFGLSMADVEVMGQEDPCKGDVPVIYADIEKLDLLPLLRE